MFMQKYVVFATIQDANSNITGYRLFDITTLSVRDIPRDKIKEGVDLIFDAKWDNSFKGLVSTCEFSISELPVIDSSSQGIKGFGGLFLYEVVTDQQDEVIGVVLYDTNGARGAVTYESLLGLLESKTEVKRLETINFSISTNNIGKRALIEMQSEYKPPRRKLDPYKSTSFRITDSRERMKNVGVMEKRDTEKNPNIVPVIPVYNLAEAGATMFNSRAGSKLMQASSYLKVLAPYYWVLLSTLKKRPATDSVLETLGVTEDTLYYNSAFVSTLTDGELVFILMHEVMHVAMCHAARHGKRDHELWNIATDLYINEMLVHDFELVPGVEKKISVTGLRGTDVNIPLCAPIFAYYFSRIGEVLNLSKDLPELIYMRLYEENPPQNRGGGGGTGGKGSESSDVSSGNGQGGKDPFENEQDVSGKMRSVQYNGKELTGACLDDIKSNVGHDTEDNKQKSEEQSLQKLQDMVTKKQMVEEKTGSELTKGMAGAELLQRMIEYNLTGGTDWRKILRNIAKGRPKKTYTLGSPNEAYMNLGITVADRRRIGKPDRLKGIIFAIDVSGSVSDEILSFLLSEVESIFNQYDVDGCIMYWNTKVCSYGHFSKRQDMRKVDNNFTGGTNVKCVFDFIAGKTDCEGKKFDIKSRDVQAIFIVTDGLFDNNYAEYESAYGKKTMWMLDGNPFSFSPCFGKVVRLSKHD